MENIGEYKQESWQMTEEEKLNAVPKLHEQANALYKIENYKEAAQNYAQAIGFLEQLMLKLVFKKIFMYLFYYLFCII